MCDHHCGLGVTTLILTSGQIPGWGFFRGFPSAIRQMSGKLRSQPSPDIIGHHKIPFSSGANDLRCCQGSSVSKTCDRLGRFTSPNHGSDSTCDSRDALARAAGGWISPRCNLCNVWRSFWDSLESEQNFLSFSFCLWNPAFNKCNSFWNIINSFSLA